MHVQMSSLLDRAREWKAEAERPTSQQVREITVPLPNASESSLLAKQLGELLSDERLRQLSASTVNFNIIFENNSHTQVAFQTLVGAASSQMFAQPGGDLAVPQKLASPAPQPPLPTLTIAQGAAGGVVLGGIGGAGLAALLQGLKSSADAFGNPYLSTIGCVLLGMAGGGLAGTLVATSTNITFTAKRPSGDEYTASFGKGPAGEEKE